MSKTDKSKQIEALVYSGDPTFQNVYPSLYIDVRSVGVTNFVEGDVSSKLAVMDKTMSNYWITLMQLKSLLIVAKS